MALCVHCGDVEARDGYESCCELCEVDQGHSFYCSSTKMTTRTQSILTLLITLGKASTADEALEMYYKMFYSHESKDPNGAILEELRAESAKRRA